LVLQLFYRDKRRECIVGTVSTGKSVIDRRLDNYNIEGQAIEKKLGNSAVQKEKKERLRFRRRLIGRKVAQLAALMR